MAKSKPHLLNFINLAKKRGTVTQGSQTVPAGGVNVLTTADWSRILGTHNISISERVQHHTRGIYLTLNE